MRSIYKQRTLFALPTLLFANFSKKHRTSLLGWKSRRANLTLACPNPSVANVWRRKFGSRRLDCNNTTVLSHRSEARSRLRLLELPPRNGTELSARGPQRSFSLSQHRVGRSVHLPTYLTFAGCFTVCVRYAHDASTTDPYLSTPTRVVIFYFLLFSANKENNENNAIYNLFLFLVCKRNLMFLNKSWCIFGKL